MAVEVNQQTICPHCEEMVHRYAARCPYCQHSLAQPVVPSSSISADVQVDEEPVKEPEASKITQMPLAAPFGHESISEDRAISPQSMLYALLPLILLLSGSFFFFFGLIIRFFSKQGQLILQWTQSSWPYFVFPSALLILAGVVFLSKTDIHDDGN